jgi:hypothetical protein
MVDRRTGERRTNQRPGQDRRERVCRQADRLGGGVPTERGELAAWLEAMLEYRMSTGQDGR